MLEQKDLALHGLTLRQLANAEQLADILDMDSAEVEKHLLQAVGDGKVVAAKGNFMISPQGRDYLDILYPTAFAEQRANSELVETLANFEKGINKKMLTVMTSWQTVTVDGAQQPNDHSDPDYDAKVIDQLANVHDRVTTLLAPFADADPLTKRFLFRLDAALARVDQGDHEYVSNVRLDSYHTVWYQMHEHLLRMMGEERDE